MGVHALAQRSLHEFVHTIVQVCVRIRAEVYHHPRKHVYADGYTQACAPVFVLK